MVGGMAENRPEPMEVQAQDSNPHAHRIEAEHNYACTAAPQMSHSQEQQRVLPQWLLVSQDEPSTVQTIQKQVPDGVLNYASAVMMACCC